MLASVCIGITGAPTTVPTGRVIPFVNVYGLTTVRLTPTDVSHKGKELP